MREWLPEDHFAWLVINAVDAIDLEPFYAAYRRDGRSRPAYDLVDDRRGVALRLRAPCQVVTGAERARVEDVACRVLAAQSKADHAMLARFVERHQDALAGVFGSVLALCAKAGWSAWPTAASSSSTIALACLWSRRVSLWIWS
ncbi:hypothetical protein [Candidatus Solirubrobacter pratensis]|uniref:hypothetical protein n=1 Tax=Candidatus Solirubrobacter pratensis TaxID=1298857 RepID=UPI000410A909|nr:hypothetical protein [Candidatus Solirubrobacter pratensis]